MNPHSSCRQSRSVVAAAALTLLLATAITACSPKPSTDESAAQTKAMVDQAVAEAKKEMLAEQAASKDKQDAVAAAQAEAKDKQDAAIAQAVANARKDFEAEQRASEEKMKKQRLDEQRASEEKARAHTSNRPTVTVSECTHCGVVISVNEIEAEGQGSGLGVVAGGVVGGVLGNQIGGGSGRDLATIAGAVGGAFAGNKIEKIAKKTRRYEIVVKMNSGEERTFKQSTVPNVARGDKVKVENGMIVRR